LLNCDETEIATPVVVAQGQKLCLDKLQCDTIVLHKFRCVLIFIMSLCCFCGLYKIY